MANASRDVSAPGSNGADPELQQTSNWLIREIGKYRSEMAWCADHADSSVESID
jgi:hypothetical protein